MGGLPKVEKVDLSYEIKTICISSKLSTVEIISTCRDNLKVGIYKDYTEI